MVVGMELRNVHIREVEAQEYCELREEVSEKGVLYKNWGGTKVDLTHD